MFLEANMTPITTMTTLLRFNGHTFEAEHVMTLNFFLIIQLFDDIVW
jgi:hypothetical protein